MTILSLLTIGKILITLGTDHEGVEVGRPDLSVEVVQDLADRY